MSYPQFSQVPQTNPYYQSPPQILQVPPRSQPVPIPTATYVTVNVGSSTSASTANTGPSGHSAPFKAPAHKHAHHLHSIPPKEKSTRTLIIDHLLWVHCRTRFAQARAELGMSDRTGGSSSPNYIHRERPENYEEEDEAYSDGEDVSVLRTRSGWLQDREDERQTRQDPQLATSLRTRSESVEKVVNSMLNQPPALHPLHPDDLVDAQGQSKQNPHGTNSHPHALPNGVRLRVALATLINDFFARQMDPVPTQTSTSYLPPAIVPLLPISGFISSPDTSCQPQSQIQHTHTHPHATPTIRTRSLYTLGVDFSSAPTSRCSRHLYTACTVCNAPTGRQEHNARPNNPFTASVGGVTGWQDGGGIGSGLAKPAVQGNVLRRDHGESTNMVELLIRFLRLSALVAMELGSEAVDDRSSVEGNGTQWGDQQQRSSSPYKGKARAASTSAPSAPSSPTNHRFPRDVQKQIERERMHTYALRPSKEWYMLCAGLVTRAVLEGYTTYGWTGLCAVEKLMKVGLGLGSTGMEVNVEGNNDSEANDAEDDPFAEFDPDDFPTLLESAKVLFPALKQTTFGSEDVPRDGPEAEYELEMNERLVRFYDVPPTAPDLSTHLEDLSWQHPAEPLERAALRFFEAIAKWRGRPELETYKKKPNRAANMESSDMSGPLSIDLLVNSSPIGSTLTMPSSGMKGPGIDRYFLAPASANIQPGVLGFGGGSKRRRESIVLDSAKRMRQGQMGDSMGMM